MVMAETWWDRISSKQKLAFCCNGLLPAHHSAKTTWKDLATDGQDGRKQAPTPVLAEDCIWGKGRQGTPHRSAREAEMVTQTMGSAQACVRLASMCECLGKRSALSPPTPARTQTHCCPAWNTWYISSGIWLHWLLAAALRLRQLGVLALPLHQLPVAPPG